MNWKTFRLEEVCTKVTDGTHDTPATIPDGYPLIKGKDISSGYLDFENCSHVSEAEHLAIIKRSKPEKGDILFANIGNSIGDCVYIKAERPFSIKNIALFKPNPEMIQSRFLFYIVSGEKFIGEILAAKSGSAQPFVSLAALRRHEIKVPPLPIQQKIAGILSAYDDLIENNLKRIKLLEELAQITYEEWFVRLRFPGHKSTSVNPETNLPEGWEIKKVGTLIGKAPKSKKIKSSEIQDNGLIPVVDQSRDFVAGYTNEQESLIDIAHPIIIFGDHTRVLKFINFPFGRGADGTQVIISNERRMPQHLFYHALLNLDLSDYHYARHYKFLKELEVIVPDEIVASQYEQGAAEIFNSIKVLRNQNQRLREARDILLPRLMTGMVDVEQYDPAQLLEEAV